MNTTLLGACTPCFHHVVDQAYTHVGKPAYDYIAEPAFTFVGDTAIWLGRSVGPVGMIMTAETICGVATIALGLQQLWGCKSVQARSIVVQPTVQIKTEEEAETPSTTTASSAEGSATSAEAGPEETKTPPTRPSSVTKSSSEDSLLTAPNESPDEVQTKSVAKDESEVSKGQEVDKPTAGFFKKAYGVTSVFARVISGVTLIAVGGILLVEAAVKAENLGLVSLDF